MWDNKTVYSSVLWLGGYGFGLTKMGPPHETQCGRDHSQAEFGYFHIVKEYIYIYIYITYVYITFASP